MVGNMVTHTRFRGPAQITASGHPFYVTSPRASEVRIDDIAAQLSRECRWAGALRDEIEIFTVAQHSVLVAHVVQMHPDYNVLTDGQKRMLRKYALLHDAEEAYTKDIVKPMKVAIKGNYEFVCDRIRAAIFRSQGLFDEAPTFMWDIVKWADKSVCAAEREQIRAEAIGDWETAEWIEPADIKIIPLGCFESMRIFLKTYADLWREEDATY